MSLVLLLPLFTTLGLSLTDKFISNEEYLGWVKVIFSILESGSDLELRFKALETKLATRLDAGEHFTEADFDAIVFQIAGRDLAWSQL